MSVHKKKRKTYVLRVDERTCMHKSVQIQTVFELMCVMCAGKVRHNGLSGKRHGHTQLSNIPVLVGGRAWPALHEHTNFTAETQTQHNRDGKVQTICSKQRKHC